jgi:DNA ligase (NAD+)
MMKVDQLEKASAAYYAGNPIMTDAEFDAAVVELRENNPDHPFLKRIGAPVPGKEKVAHKIAMGSLANANNKEEFETWIPDDNPTIFLSHKMDGSSLELVYENGSFVQAITRGNGELGEDVTKNVVKSGNVPLTIDPSIVSVRCECLIHVADWTAHFGGDANPRNSAAGTLRRHDGHNAKYLQFYAFDALFTTDKIDDGIFAFSKSECGILTLLKRWFSTPFYALANDLESLVSWCREVEYVRETHPYEIDGVVAKIDDRTRSQNMGSRNGRPRGQIAIKFKPRGGETILNKVIWQVGHTGSLTPVGEVSPVGVGGTIVKRVTLCNMDEIDRLDIAIGDTVEIIRAGDVIPKLSKCVKKGKQRLIICPPKQCPECGSKTAKDGARLFCTNDLCGGQSLGRVMTWIKKRDILNLGIGVIKAANIKSIRHLYEMSLDEWAKVQVGNGVLGEKRAKKILVSLYHSKYVSLSEFLGSIGIKGVGRSLCRDICNGLGVRTLDNIFAIRPEHIEKLEGFGQIRAYDFCNWLLEYRKDIIELAGIMNFETEFSKGNQVFDNETICFTGKSPKPRQEMSKLAEAAGASVSSSVNNNTTILVIADIDSTSSKAVKARKIGIKLMSPDEFLEQVGEL